MTVTPTVDFEALKARQQTTWSSGNYAVIGSTLQLAGEALCETVDVAAGERVLDVAAGNGNAALAAARRGAEVTASDWVAAEALPFTDGAYDVVLSTFGAMFVPRQEQVVAELLRVCRPGGRIGLANWTPDSFVGRMFKVVGRYVPPPSGIRSPLEWGTRVRIGELFGTEIDSIAVREREFVFRYRSAEDWLDTFRSSYGPMRNAFASLGPADQTALAHDLIALAHADNTTNTGSLRVPSEYVEVVAVRAA